MNMQMLTMVLLATVCAGALAWLLVYPYLSGEKEAEKRMQSVTRTGAPALKAASRAVRTRRERSHFRENSFSTSCGEFGTPAYSRTCRHDQWWW